MPLVTEDFFTAFERILIWRWVFVFGCGFIGSTIVSLPILMMSPHITAICWLLWIVGILCIVVGGLRWRYWRGVQKRSIVDY